MTSEDFKRLKRERDPKMMVMSEISTPDDLSIDGKSDNKADLDQDSEEVETKENKPYSSYIVRMKDEPKSKNIKNRFDTYLTKTSIRAIKFSENKKRWQRIVENDLYSKT